MDPSHHSNDIERQLAGLRSALVNDARAAAADARTLADWHYHVRAHPWLACGGAFLVGFLLAPGRARPRELATAAQNEIAARFDSANSPAQASMAKTLLGLAANYAARQGLAYLTDMGRTMLERSRRRDVEPDVGHLGETGTRR